MARIVLRRLLAAEHDKRVMVARPGQAAIGEGAEDVDHRAGLGQRDADLTVMGDRGILDERDAHGQRSPGFAPHSARAAAAFKRDTGD